MLMQYNYLEYLYYNEISYRNKIRIYFRIEDLIEEEGSTVTPIDEDIEVAKQETKKAVEEFKAEEVVEPEPEVPVTPAKDVEPTPEEVKVEVPEEPVRPRIVDDVRENALDEATKRFKSLKLDDPNANTEAPKLGALITKVRDETELHLHKHKEEIAKAYIADKPVDAKNLEGALKEVRFLQNVYEIKHRVDTFAGRFLGSMSKDAAAKFKYTNELSEAATEQSHALIRLENALIEQINGVKHNEFLVELHNKYLEIRPAQKEKSKQIRKKLREQYESLPPEEQQQILEPKQIDEVKAQAARITKLEKELQERQEIFAGLKEEPTPKKPRERTLQEEDLQARLKFYKTDSRESREIAGLEEKLDRFFKLLDEGDIEKIRQEVGPAPEWVKPDKVNELLSFWV